MDQETSPPSYEEATKQYSVYVDITTSLGSGASYISGWFFSSYPNLLVVCRCDNAATLYFDRSDDGGTNYDTFPVNGISIGAKTRHFHSFSNISGVWRVRIVNNKGSQSCLRMYVIGTNLYATAGTALVE